MNTIPLVKGEITFEEGAPPFTDATVYVYLENVTAADAASEVLAAYVEHDAAFDQKTPGALTFAITGRSPDPRARYAVRVHIDIEGNGEVSRALTVLRIRMKSTREILPW